MPEPGGATILLVGARPGRQVCERGSADWLCDTLDGLAQTAVRLGTRSDLRVATVDRPAAEPAAGRSTEREPAGVVGVLSTSTPLMGRRTIERALSRAAAGAVVVVPAGPRGDPAAGRDLLVAMPADRWPRLAALFTDGLPSLAAVRRRLPVVVLAPAGPVEALDVADPFDRSRIRAVLDERIMRGWLARGVEIEDPATTRIGPHVVLAAGCTIRRSTELTGTTRVGAGSIIGPGATLTDTTVGRDSVLRHCVTSDAVVGDAANVGPFAWLRSGARIADRARIGVFVEIANSTVGADSAVAHLSVLSGADVAEGCNIGGLTGFANYDGAAKHRTTVRPGAWIGGGNLICAPVTIGDGAYTAAGSTITEDVPAGALGVARGRQRNVEGWVARNRPGTGASRDGSGAGPVGPAPEEG